MPDLDMLVQREERPPNPSVLERWKDHESSRVWRWTRLSSSRGEETGSGAEEDLSGSLGKRVVEELGVWSSLMTRGGGARPPGVVEVLERVCHWCSTSEDKEEGPDYSLDHGQCSLVTPIFVLLHFSMTLVVRVNFMCNHLGFMMISPTCSMPLGPPL